MNDRLSSLVVRPGGPLAGDNDPLLKEIENACSLNLKQRLPSAFNEHLMWDVKVKTRGIRQDPASDVYVCGGYVLELTIPAADLAANLQNERAALPWAALCFAAWLEEAASVSVDAKVHVTDLQGRLSDEDKLELSRSMFLLEEVSRCCPRLNYESRNATLNWRWPERYRLIELNVENRQNKGAGDEFQFESALLDPKYASAFSDNLDKLSPKAFTRQLKATVVDKSNTREPYGTRMLPYGVIDLCANGESSFHILELKGTNVDDFSIVPQILYYARLFAHLRDDFDYIWPPARERLNTHAERNLIKKEQRIIAWLTVSAIHPLIQDRAGNSPPLSRLNEGLKNDNVEIRILPWEGTTVNPILRFDKIWPASARP